MDKMHLVCNAHLDPVWLWRWDDGVAEAISTFRVAADFCEEFDTFIFNHNEVILYEWVEEYEPQLFKRIQRLVSEGKWHIMGGWYLQPDCNMPSGEGFIRQIEVGRKYFSEKFGKTPTTAINFDPFGHTRGLVQILKKTGHDSYFFCRPLREFKGKLINEWGYDDFIWGGYDGSEIIGHRHFDIYLSRRGKAVDKIQKYIDVREDKEIGLLSWGIGNHGGGPSKIDLERIGEFIENNKDIEIVHSTPENYFAELKEKEYELPKVETDMNPWAVGCLTTLAEIKKRYRMLESEMFLTEKMVSHAALEGLMEYPEEQLLEAQKDLLFAQFHDVLPGTVVPTAEQDSLNSMAHGLDILSRIKTKAFFKLAGGQKKANTGEIPILIYNPHPFKIKGNFECEFNLEDECFSEYPFKNPVVYKNGERLLSQYEQEESNMPEQWRRKVVFNGELEPCSMNRFNCIIEDMEKRNDIQLKSSKGYYEFDNGEIRILINCYTGLVDELTINGTSYLNKEAFIPIVINDDDHSIGTFVKDFRNVIGHFTLMDKQESTEFAGVYGKVLDSVRVVEDSEVRIIIESDLEYHNSAICLRYILPKKGTEIQVQLIVHWNEKNKMLKLSIPTASKTNEYWGQVAYGKDVLYNNGDETVSQKWSGVLDKYNNTALTIINDRIYGSDYKNGEIRLSLLRSPRYGCLAKEEDRRYLYNDGYVYHTDQGVNVFNFWINGGDINSRMETIDNEALIKHEKPYILSFFPSGDGEIARPLIELDNEAVMISAFKKQIETNQYILRLYNTVGNPSKVNINIPLLGVGNIVEMGSFEVKTLLLNVKRRTIIETNMLGE
ncbi:glycoside hydrolase family 38 C-terminal domain-containing protein [Vallitalea guaymasensis]|uniref:glycoside hydrolase family 38 N-terminal domain-containing protein n=1 Tax=Vallitalea guaymasensis TaxID=1185412 RepID=UPI00272A393F|nr:alpha-mannosidase [Vallitalea guaymasensis]